MTTHTWLATCPVCGTVQGAAVDEPSERIQTFVRVHLLAGYTMLRLPRDEARERARVGFTMCGDHRLTPHTGGREPVALRGYVPVTVSPDWPLGSMDATRGVYPIVMNRHGAASAILPDGSLLGLKPHEFVWTDAPASAHAVSRPQDAPAPR